MERGKVRSFRLVNYRDGQKIVQSEIEDEIGGQPMEDKTKKFYCGHCLIEFKIEVEPDYVYEEVRREFPESLSWLGKIKICPVCQIPLKTRDPSQVYEER